MRLYTGPYRDHTPPLPLVDLRSTGTLWFINKRLFHPMGHALALATRDGDTQPSGWNLYGDGSEPWAFESDEPEATAWAEFLQKVKDQS